MEQEYDQRGPTSQPTRAGGAATPLGAPPGLVGTYWLISRSPLAIKSYFDLEKIIENQLLGLSAAVSRRNQGRSTFALRRSDSAGETSLREGEIEAFIITNTPLIVGGIIFINIFISTISSPNPSSSLCVQSLYQTSDWYLGVLVVLITSCS